MSLSGDKGVAQFKKSVKMEHPSARPLSLWLRQPQCIAMGHWVRKEGGGACPVRGYPGHLQQR